MPMISIYVKDEIYAKYLNQKEEINAKVKELVENEIKESK